jgi:hypothetical protein
MSYTDAQAGLNSWSNNYNKPFFSPEQQQNYMQGLNNWNSNPNIGQDLMKNFKMGDNPYDTGGDWFGGMTGKEGFGIAKDAVNMLSNIGRYNLGKKELALTAKQMDITNKFAGANLGNATITTNNNIGNANRALAAQGMNNFHSLLPSYAVPTFDTTKIG